MKSITAPLDEPNKIKLTVELEQHELDEAIEKAFKTIAKQVNIPGFRRGKAPRKLIEAQFGTEAARAQALNDSLPDYYVRALRENDIDAIAAPKIDITSGEDEGTVIFEAEVETRPVPDIPGYENLKVEIPNPRLSPDEIEKQIENFRRQFADLTEVDRPCREGDYVTLDIETERDGERVAGLNVTDFSYEVGGDFKSFGPDFDKKIDGLSKGDEVEFTTTIPPNDDEVEMEVEVKMVEEQVLPELTDEFVEEHSEHSTVAEFREDLEKHLTEHKRHEAGHAVESNALVALSELVTEDVPESLVESEMRREYQSIDANFRQRGFSLETFIEVSGQTEELFYESLRERSTVAVRVDLALRALAQKENLVATDQEVDEQIALLAQQFRQKSDRIRRDLERADQLPAVRSDICKAKAVRWLIEHVALVDDEGDPIDRTLLDFDEHSHDHDDETES